MFLDFSPVVHPITWFWPLPTICLLSNSLNWTCSLEFALRYKTLISRIPDSGSVLVELKEVCVTLGSAVYGYWTVFLLMEKTIFTKPSLVEFPLMTENGKILAELPGNSPVHQMLSLTYSYSTTSRLPAVRRSRDWQKMWHINQHKRLPSHLPYHFSLLARWKNAEAGDYNFPRLLAESKEMIQILNISSWGRLHSSNHHRQNQSYCFENFSLTWTDRSNDWHCQPQKNTTGVVKTH